jgi:alanine racemase
VERAATEMKAHALMHHHTPRESVFHQEETKHEIAASVAERVMETSSPDYPRHQSSTLSNVSGQDLAREVRALLLNQANTAAAQNNHLATPKSSHMSATHSAMSSASPEKPLDGQPSRGQVFGGIEAVAKLSRNREVAFVDSLEDGPSSSHHSSFLNNGVAGPRRVLRWLALVDSGMGRLGFRTDPVADGEDRRDTVDVIKELVDCEIHDLAPIEFYGMCTHMAEASSESDYTNSQIAKFICLLNWVRSAGIFIPTVSTDNSAALLTNELTHFDPKEILSQPDADTRGFVRTGGAIYGQRPAFKQLQAVSTLLASVRHVAVLKKGETVGYDRAYTAQYDVRIATLTIGFADGYPRELGNGVGKVAIRGSVYAVAGNICMDMMMVELGPAEDTGVAAQISVRDTAVLWGPYEEGENEGLVRLQDIAATLGTTQSALTCGLDNIRVNRKYV